VTQGLIHHLETGRGQNVRSLGGAEAREGPGGARDGAPRRRV